ncbi:MAG: nucleotidyltransferase domain-containing protein [Acidobacteriota bacterium]
MWQHIDSDNGSREVLRRERVISSRGELIDQLRVAARTILGGKGILVAYAYGSRVWGNPLPFSDLDVGYYLDGYLSGAKLLLKKELDIQERLSEALGLQVDFRDLASATIEMRGRVLEEGVRIYSGNDIQRVALERDTLGRYHDYKWITMVDKPKIDQMLAGLQSYAKVRVSYGFPEAFRPLCRRNCRSSQQERCLTSRSRICTDALSDRINRIDRIMSAQPQLSFVDFSARAFHGRR